MAPPPRRRQRSRRPAPRDERGAVALFVAALVAVMLGVCALVVDLGMQRVLRSDLQAVADVVALDLVRDLDGRTAATLVSPIETARVASLRRNAAVIGDSEPVVTVELGRMTTAGVFEVVSSTTAPSAVRVTARSSVDYAFSAGRGGAVRSAVAAKTSSACYMVGTYAALVQSGRSALLNPLLRRIGQSDATLAALDYTSLATTAVNLDQLAARLGIGTVNELANATVSARGYYAAIAQVLPAGTSTTTVQALQRLQVWAQPTLTFSMGKVLGISSGSAAVVGARYNLLDLVAGSMFAINGTNFIDAYVGTLLPGITNTGLRIKLVQGPRQYCGTPNSPNTTAGSRDTEQLSATVNATLSPNVATVTVPPIAGLLGTSAPMTVHQPNNVNTTVSAAGTETTLKSITCNPGGATIDVVNGLATVTLDTNIRTTLVAELNVGVLGALTKVQVDVNAGVRVTATLSRNTVTGWTVTVPPQAYDTFYPTGSSGLSLGVPTKTGASASAHLSLLNGTLGAWVSLNTQQQTQLIDSAVNGALRAYFDASNPNSIVSTLVNPILSLAGVELAGSRIALSSRPAPDCGTPGLRG